MSRKTSKSFPSSVRCTARATEASPWWTFRSLHLNPQTAAPTRSRRARCSSMQCRLAPREPVPTMVVMGTSPTTSFPKSAEIPRGNPTKQRALELAAEFFCLRTRDAAELLRGHAATESDERSVRRTLSILHRDGFLTRLTYFAPNHERGGVGHVYGLSDKGVAHAFHNGYSTT